MYEQLPPGSFPKTIYISGTISFQEAEKLVISNNFGYPFVVKPDAGMMGVENLLYCIKFQNTITIPEFRMEIQRWLEIL